MFVTTSVCMEQRDQCQCPLWGGEAVNFDLWSGRDLERGGQINCQINITNFSYLIKLSSKYHSSLQLLINSRVGQDWIIFKCHKNFLFMKYFQCSIKIFSVQDGGGGGGSLRLQPGAGARRQAGGGVALRQQDPGPRRGARGGVLQHLQHLPHPARPHRAPATRSSARSDSFPKYLCHSSFYSSSYFIKHFFQH